MFVAPVRLFLGLVAFSLAGSLFSRLAHLDPGLIAPVASLVTLGAGVWATFAEYVRTVPQPWARLGLTLLFGAGAEVAGLATGVPFGRYAYTGAWWPTVRLGVGPFPLALPFAWLLMAGAARLSVGSPLPPVARQGGGAGGGGLPMLLTALAGGLLAAVVDLAMEPVLAGPLGYWRWLSPGPLPGGAPVANFLGWWATATFAGLVLTTGVPAGRSTAPRWVLGGFVVLILGLGVIVSR